MTAFRRLATEFRAAVFLKAFSIGLRGTGIPSGPVIVN